jgi:hypothetical protein
VMTALPTWNNNAEVIDHASSWSGFSAKSQVCNIASCTSRNSARSYKSCLYTLIYIVPNAMISSGTSTTLHRTYSAMNLPRISYVAFAVTPRSSQSCSRKWTAQIPGNSIRSMIWPS